MRATRRCGRRPDLVSPQPVTTVAPYPWSSDATTSPTPRPDRSTSSTLTRALCDVESVSGDEGAARRRRRGRAARAAAPRGAPRRRRRRRPHRARPRRAGRRSPGTSTPCRSPANLPTRLEGDGRRAVLHGPRHRRHEGRRRRPAAGRRDRRPSRPATSPSSSTTTRRSRLAATGSAGSRATTPSWIDGRLRRAAASRPSAAVEGGCNGTMRVEVITRGVAAHSARAWMGHNAIHDAGDVLARLPAYGRGRSRSTGLVYREGLNAVGISRRHRRQRHPRRVRRHGQLPVRAGPRRSRTPRRTCARCSTGSTSTVTDAAPGARPGLDHPAAAAFVAAIGAAAGPSTAGPTSPGSARWASPR